jgi:hypothetical protein
MAVHSYGRSFDRYRSLSVLHNFIIRRVPAIARAHANRGKGLFAIFAQYRQKCIAKSTTFSGGGGTCA